MTIITRRTARRCGSLGARACGRSPRSSPPWCAIRVAFDENDVERLGQQLRELLPMKRCRSSGRWHSGLNWPLLRKTCPATRCRNSATAESIASLHRGVSDLHRSSFLSRAATPHDEPSAAKLATIKTSPQAGLIHGVASGKEGALTYFGCGLAGVVHLIVVILLDDCNVPIIFFDWTPSPQAPSRDSMQHTVGRDRNAPRICSIVFGVGKGDV